MPEPQVFSSEFYEISKITLSYKKTPVAASEILAWIFKIKSKPAKIVVFIDFKIFIDFNPLSVCAALI